MFREFSLEKTGRNLKSFRDFSQGFVVVEASGRENVKNFYLFCIVLAGNESIVKICRNYGNSRIEIINFSILFRDSGIY